VPANGSDAQISSVPRNQAHQSRTGQGASSSWTSTDPAVLSGYQRQNTNHEHALDGGIQQGDEEKLIGWIPGELILFDTKALDMHIKMSTYVEGLIIGE